MGDAARDLIERNRGAFRPVEIGDFAALLADEVAVRSGPGVVTGAVDVIHAADDSFCRELIEDPINAFAGDCRLGDSHRRPYRVHIRMVEVIRQKIVNCQSLRRAFPAGIPADL